MPKKAELEVAALRQKFRADQLLERESDLNHAINLLLNDAVEWFQRTLEGPDKTHHFGLGIAMGVEPANPLRAMILRGPEDRVIVFWKTEFEVEERTQKYVSAYNVKDFKTFPGRIRVSGADNSESIANLIDSAVRALDAAVVSYRKSRGVWQHIM